MLNTNIIGIYSNMVTTDLCLSMTTMSGIRMRIKSRGKADAKLIEQNKINR